MQSLSYPPDAPAVAIIPQTIMSLSLNGGLHASAQKQNWTNNQWVPCLTDS